MLEVEKGTGMGTWLYEEVAEVLDQCKDATGLWATLTNPKREEYRGLSWMKGPAT